ncbi:MAG: GNAT family N-acetyltransferase [Deinococcota bacterium]
MTALRALFKKQNAHQHKLEPKLRHFSDEGIDTYIARLKDAERDVIEVRDSNNAVRAAAVLGVLEYPNDSSMLALFPKRCGVAPLLSLPSPENRAEQQESMELLFKTAEDYWQDKGATGAVVSWVAHDPWLGTVLEPRGFLAYSTNAVRDLDLPLRAAQPKGDLDLRPAKSADEDLLVQLLVDEMAFHEGITPFDKVVPALATDARDRLTKVWAGQGLEDGASLFWVAEEQGDVVGMIEVTLSDLRNTWNPLAAGRYGYISAVMVAASQRGQGVGRALLEAAFKALEDYELDAYSLHFIIANPLSSRFWQSHGFQPVTLSYQKRYAVSTSRKQ